MVYFFVGFLISFTSLIEIFSKNKNFRNIFFIISLIALLIIVSFRDGSSVGIDSPTYFNAYKFQLSGFEIGYSFLNNLFSKAAINYNIFIFFINCLAIFNIAKFIRRNSHYYILPIFIYFSDFFLYYNMSGVRQAIALSFTALSISYIFNKKKKLALFYIVLASLFHVSSLIFLLVLFIPTKKLSAKNYIKLIIGFGVLILGFDFIITYFPQIQQKFIFYSEIQQQSEGYENIQFNFIVGIVKRILVLIPVLITVRTLLANDKLAFIFNIYLVGFIIYILTFLTSPDIGVRLSSYFTIVDTVLICNYIGNFKKFSNKVIILLIFIIIGFYKIYTYTLIPEYAYQLVNF